MSKAFPATKTVFFYTATIPDPRGYGSNLRVYTNIRAYIDNGFDVHLQLIRSPKSDQIFPPQELNLKHYQQLSITYDKPGFLKRVAYWIGAPKDMLLDFAFPERQLLRMKVIENQHTYPKSIHHFEYLGPAASMIGLHGVKSVWSCLDLEVDRFLKVRQMRSLIGYQKPLEKMVRLRSIRLAEQEVVKSSHLVLMIAEHERKILADRFCLPKIRHFPMSWPDETRIARTRSWMANGKLYLLHIGKINNLSAYYSLKYLLVEVFPKLPQSILDRIELWVAGEITSGAYCQEILFLASTYPQVHLFGYIDDLKELYSQADLQVVGSDIASGLRTRIIESFVRGLPVLSTQSAAEGVRNLIDGENILLAKSADCFARHLVSIIETPSLLENLAGQGRKLYDQEYSRDVAAECLKQLLSTFVYNSVDS